MGNTFAFVNECFVEDESLKDVSVVQMKFHSLWQNVTAISVHES